MLGYQNTVANLADGPNAMLLHLPTRRLVPEQFVSVGRHGDVLRRMVDAVAAPPVEADGMAAMDWLGAEPEPVVRVFEHDVYTVLLADDPTLIHTALHRVPWKRRPRIEPELLVFYAEHFPDHAIALCCFDNADARQAKPLLVWYHPNDPDQLTVPALDSHTGGPRTWMPAWPWTTGSCSPATKRGTSGARPSSTRSGCGTSCRNSCPTGSWAATTAMTNPRWPTATSESNTGICWPTTSTGWSGVGRSRGHESASRSWPGASLECVRRSGSEGPYLFPEVR